MQLGSYFLFSLVTLPFYLELGKTNLIYVTALIGVTLFVMPVRSKYANKVIIRSPLKCKNQDCQGLCVSGLRLYTILATSLHLEMGLGVLSLHQS